MSLRSCNRALVAASVVGMLVSTYALYVEMAAEAKPGYKALCDLAERASCSRVLTSEFSKGFGVTTKDSAFEIPNCIYGIVFYCLMIFLSTYDNSAVLKIQEILAYSSVGTSLYLAYLLAVVLQDFCIVCVSTYFVNGFTALFVHEKKQALKKLADNSNIIANKDK